MDQNTDAGLHRRFLQACRVGDVEELRHMLTLDRPEEDQWVPNIHNMTRIRGLTLAVENNLEAAQLLCELDEYREVLHKWAAEAIQIADLELLISYLQIHDYRETMEIDLTRCNAPDQINLWVLQNCRRVVANERTFMYLCRHGHLEAAKHISEMTMLRLKHWIAALLEAGDGRDEIVDWIIETKIAGDRRAIDRCFRKSCYGRNAETVRKLLECGVSDWEVMEMYDQMLEAEEAEGVDELSESSIESISLSDWERYNDRVRDLVITYVVNKRTKSARSAARVDEESMLE